MSGHTPGPWRVIDRYDPPSVVDDKGFAVVDLPTLSVVTGWDERFPGLEHWGLRPGEAYIERSSEEQEANARLIAAAPEMYEALRALNDALRESWDAGRLPHDAVPVEITRAAYSAIAKAEGRQP